MKDTGGLCPTKVEASARRGEPTMNANTRDEGQFELLNGCLLRIRPLRRGEDGAVRELCARLSLRTRYLRFLLAMPVLPDSVVRMLADVDDPRRLALIAELDNADGGDVVALGNVGTLDDGRAEVGLVVADAWQRQGIGVALAARLLHAAGVRGYQRFVVYGLSDNPALRPLLNHLADVVSTETRDGVSEITFVRREPAAVLTSAIRCSPKSRVKDPLEKAYERILAAQGRESRRSR
jgi:GNAT superfamily N-acetyltransferase